LVPLVLRASTPKKIQGGQKGRPDLGRSWKKDSQTLLDQSKTVAHEVVEGFKHPIETAKSISDTVANDATAVWGMLCAARTALLKDGLGAAWRVLSGSTLRFLSLPDWWIKAICYAVALLVIAFAIKKVFFHARSKRIQRRGRHNPFFPSLKRQNHPKTQFSG
jgi:hypothetical protein